ncbi:MAG TPA: mechanosensitive ion channel [Planctomycetota bacterium]|nr:mechanosensitive ion channel [Planctomycetota bacterium]
MAASEDADRIQNALPAFPEIPGGWYQGLSLDQQRLFWALAGLAVLALGVWLLGLVWRRVLLPLSRRTSTRLDGIVLEHARRPALALAAAGGMNALFHWVTEGLGFARSVPGQIAGGLLYSAVVLAVALVAYAVVAAVADWYLVEIAARTATPMDNKLVPLFRRVAKIVVLFIAVTVILGHFDVKIAALLGAAGVASLAVALAAQETVANMIAGFTILVDRPFRIGDRIQLADGLTGDVHEIGLRSTKIMTFDHALVILPNKEISGARIVNLSYPDPRLAIRRDFTVAYGTDPDKVKRVLTAIAGAHPKVLKEPAPAVFFTDFGDSALVFKLVCHVADYRDAFPTVDELNMAVNRRFAEEGIEIPFPQRDIHVRSIQGVVPPAPMAPAAQEGGRK